METFHNIMKASPETCYWCVKLEKMLCKGLPCDKEKDCKVILGLIEIFIVTLSTAIRISHYNLFNIVAVKVVAKQCCLMLFFFQTAYL